MVLYILTYPTYIFQNTAGHFVAKCLTMYAVLTMSYMVVLLSGGLGKH